MKLATLLFVPLALAGSGVLLAETLLVDDQVMVRESSVERPAKGSSMKTVESRFGAPAMRHATVGQPPITRWDYPGFAVFFEHDHVIHSVATAP
jgi:hypothetical protein